MRGFGIGQVGFVATVPEEKRLTVLALTQELLEVPRVVFIGNALLRLFRQFQRIVLHAGRVFLAAPDEPVAWPPPLARETDLVASRLQVVDEGLVVDRKRAAVSTRRPDHPVVLSRQQRRPGW